MHSTPPRKGSTSPASPKPWSALLVGTALLAGCGGADEPGGGADSSAEAEASGPVRVLNTVPRFQLVDQAGKVFGSKRLEGKVWIATFIFTRCGATCPAQTAAFAKLQEDLADHPAAKDIRLVSITVDPEFDSPAVLADYAQKAGADPERWSFLTGKKDQLTELCRDGFKLPVEEAKGDAPITHSQSFVLVDRARRVRGHYDGLNEDAVARLVTDIDRILDDPQGPPTKSRKNYFDDKNPGPIVHVPKEGKDTPWMAERAAAQKATTDEFDVYHDFGFTDRLPESGITFVSHVVDDATIDYKAVHYDHGNGLAIADVDGDGLHDVYFVSQIGANQLYKNLGGGKFADITEGAGVGLADRVSVTASFADIDNDGDADLYVTTVRHGNALFLNNGQGVFEDVTDASGLGIVEHCSSAVFFDYDRDGLLDLFLTVVGEYTTEEVGRGGYYVGHRDAFSGQTKPHRFRQSHLFRNEGGVKFADTTEATGLVDKSWTGAATPIDLNEDGWQDLYVLNMQGHDEYWENQGGKRFVKRSREIFPATPWGSMGVKVFDFDNDGDMDIYVTDMHTDMIDDALQSKRYWYAEKMKMTDHPPREVLMTDGNHVLGNAFFQNQGGGTFREVSDEIGAENYWPWGLSVGDLNADGYEDAVLTSSMNYPFRYAVNSVLLNNLGRKFLDSEFILGVEPRRDGQTSAPWFTLDCDGDDKDHPACAKRSGEIEVWATVGSRSSAIFDMDLDGDLDIITNEFNTAPMVLISDLSERRPDLRYLMVDLVGVTSNRDGIGARVEVKVGDTTYTKVQDGQSGYMAQSVYPLYFGLGEAGAVDSITVTWPNGSSQSVTGPIEANQLFTVTEE